MKFRVLSRDRENFYLNDIDAKDEDTAYQIIEDDIATNTSQEWLLDEEQFNKLKNIIDSAKNGNW